jgi:hypothetical protein
MARVASKKGEKMLDCCSGAEADLHAGSDVRERRFGGRMLLVVMARHSWADASGHGLVSSAH